MHLNRIILPLVFLCFALVAEGQINPEFQVIKGKKNETVTSIIKSIGATPFVTNEALIGDFGALEINPLSGDLYELTYEPDFNYTGQIDLHIEYYDVGIFPGFPSIRYSTYRHEIKESLVTTSDEIYLSDSPSLNLDPLANDYASDGALTVSELAFVAGGSASINADGTIDFSFDAGSQVGYVSYIAEDDFGTGDNGLIRIFNSDVALEEEVPLSVNNKSSIDFYLVDETLELIGAPLNGSYETSDFITYTYTPNIDFVGQEEISFENADGEECTFVLDVVDKTLGNSFVRNDYIYTSVNESIVFDVRENDLRTEFEIVDHSPELTLLDDGTFSYTPNPDEDGAELFYYKIFSGLMFHQALVFVSVNDFEPIVQEGQAFDVVAGSSFYIEHNAPITGYTFEVLTEPAHGILDIHSGGTTIITNCNGTPTLEESTVEYFAEPGYEGPDAFEVNYCAPGGGCYVVKVDINVVPNDGSCICDVDCVWPGDFNQDGIVNMRDLMTFGMNVGGNGQARDVQGSSWSAYSSADWEFENMSLDADLKHLDADGNGYITWDDATAITENYGKQNKLVSSIAYAATSTPVVLSTTQTEVDSGEWLILDVALGDDLEPYVDFYGLTFQFNIDPGLIDETSACFQLNDGSWVGYDSPMIEMFEMPEEGSFSMGFTRLSGLPVSGQGPIGVLKFIVEEEIDGFRDSDGKFTMRLGLDDAVGYDAMGNPMALSTNKVEVDLNLRNKNKDKLQAHTYPNPASDHVLIETNRVVDFVSVIDISGRVVDQYAAPKQQTFEHSFANYSDGIYFIQLISGDDVEIQKVSLLGSH